jgi:hypothetical protein
MFIGQYAASCIASSLAYCACQACQWGSREALTHSARVAWSALFFMAMVVAWIMRDFAKPLLEKIPCKWCGAVRGGCGGSRKLARTCTLHHTYTTPHLTTQGLCATRRILSLTRSGLGSKPFTVSAWATL